MAVHRMPAFTREMFTALSAAAWFLSSFVAPAWAQTAPSRTPTVAPAPSESAAHQTAGDASASEGQLEQIKHALASGAHPDLDERQRHFYAEVIAKAPRFSDHVRGYDLMNGPTRGGDPMSYREFMNMTAPKEMSYANGATAAESLGLTIANYLGQSLIKQALADVKQARTDRDVADIRDRVERELAALTHVEPR